MSINPAPTFRELLDAPPLHASVRAASAQRVIGWVLAPLWVVIIGVTALGLFLAAEGGGDYQRIAPVALAVPTLLYVARLRRAGKWMRSGAVLAFGLFVSISATVLINSVHAPVYQAGFILLALVIPLFGNRWGFVVAAALVVVGALSVMLGHSGLGLKPQYPTGEVQVAVYVGNMLVALVTLGGVHRLLAEALHDARRKHREAEAARAAEAASELAFHGVFEHASVGMLLLTNAGIIARLNRHAAQRLGAHEQQLLGSTLEAAQLWNEEQKHVLADAVAKAAGGQGSRHELTVSGPLGAQTVYQVSVTAFETRGDGLVLVELVDVTDLVRTRAMLAQARRLEALGKLSGGVAHDINNMLAAIMGGCELLEDTQRVNTGREVIEASVLRASALIKQLLAFGRQDRFESVEIDVNHLIIDTGRLFERTLHKNVVLKVEPWREPALVRGDRPALENALLNLALNAQDAMPDGGTLSLTARVAQVDDTCSARLNRAIAPGRAVVISMRDTGTGMTESVRERLFEPFFTTKAAGKGAGLGLAAVHGTVRAHHGAIDVSSKAGHGSVFELYFPEIEAKPREARAPIYTPATLPEPARARPEAHFHARVLLADDEPLVRKTMVMMLTALGCEVQAVDNGEALLLALTHGATPDVIVSDLMMPGLSGLNLVRTLQATRPDCPLLLITGYTGDDVSSALEQHRSHRLLRKPFSHGQLVEALSELLQPEAQPAQSA